MGRLAWNRRRAETSESPAIGWPALAPSPRKPLRVQREGAVLAVSVPAEGTVFVRNVEEWPTRGR